MLGEKVKLSAITKEEYSEKIETLRTKMAELEQQVMREKIPVIVVFEGWGAAGKGSAIANLLGSMDPRGFSMNNIQPDSFDDRLFSFASKYGTKLPKYGEIGIFDRSWYREMTRGLADRKPDEDSAEIAAEIITFFERQFVDDGGVIVKLFLNISKKEQKKRLEALASSKETKWRATKRDFEQNKNYKMYAECFDRMLERTNFPFAPWTVIDATDKRATAVKVYETVIASISERLAEKPAAISHASWFNTLPIESVRTIDPAAKVDPQEYKERLKELKKRIDLLHNVIYKKRIPVIVCYEGWDAAGKGGNIKRLTSGMDPRGYEVFPIAAPDATEKAHHYLWRFAEKMPKAGHVAVFDRTWYGRVMVERIEGFCDEERWKQAYEEMNEFEYGLWQWGAVILKFFINIDNAEQLSRFEARRDTPDKQWKLTDEDWRNRDKWGAYEQAIDDMLQKTNTDFAPWHIIQSTDKKYARLQAMEAFIDAVEQRIGK